MVKVVMEDLFALRRYQSPECALILSIGFAANGNLTANKSMRIGKMLEDEWDEGLAMEGLAGAIADFVCSLPGSGTMAKRLSLMLAFQEEYIQRVMKIARQEAWDAAWAAAEEAENSGNE